MNNKLLLLLFCLVLSSCASSRKLVYFKDLQEDGVYNEEIRNKIEPQIQPYDQLSITVSSLSAESNMLFNGGALPTTGSVTGTSNAAQAGVEYLVNSSGAINFPILGRVELAGLTIEQATAKMTTEIKRSVKNPTVNIRLLNFKITVLGEVNRPSTFVIPSGKINILEAIGLAGDLTAFGKRGNILILREKNNTRSATRVNLNSTNILNSPDFYLQQNDVLYVEPTKSRALQSGSGSFYLPIVSIAFSILSTIVLLLR